MACNRLIGALIAGALLASAAPPVDPGIAVSLRALVAKDLRVATIAYRLQTSEGAVAFCAHHARLAGMVVQDASQYRADLRPAMTALYDLGPLPAVTGVVAGGAADIAGVRPGDAIEAIDGQPLDLPRLSSSKPQGQRYTAMTDRLDAALAAGPVRLSLRRGGQPVEVVLNGAEACASDVQLDLSQSRNAGADGRTVTISQGIVDFAHSDDELAFVIAHELSHDILGHRHFLDATHTSNSGLFAGLGRNGARVRETERQADYLGLYLVAWAGYDVHGAARFWQRMGRADPLGSLFGDGTHPGNGARVTAMEEEASAIEADRAAARPVRPDPGRLSVIR